MEIEGIKTNRTKLGVNFVDILTVDIMWKDWTDM